MILCGMYNLQDMGVVPQGKISSLNSAIIVYPRCQMTWQFISFDNSLPPLQECCWFPRVVPGECDWQCCASIQRQAFPRGMQVWVVKCFILPKPEGKTYWARLLLALQSGGILAFYANGHKRGKSLSFWLAPSWYCPACPFVSSLSPAAPFQGSELPAEALIQASM